jgi:hypothetical protein
VTARDSSEPYFQATNLQWQPKEVKRAEPVRGARACGGFGTRAASSRFGLEEDERTQPIGPEPTEAELGRLPPGTTCHNVPAIVELRGRYFTPPYPAETIAVAADAVERV